LASPAVGDSILHNVIQTFSNSEITAITAELNHLLWSDEPTNPTETVKAAIAQLPNADLLPTNMNCATHAVVCCGLMLRRGEDVATRAGSALIVYPEQQQFDEPHWVMKHYWITTSQGLCDLSLNLFGFSKHKPIIFENKNIADPNWKVIFKDDFKATLDAARKSHVARVYGVFYQTDKKLSVTLDQFASDSTEIFSSARTRGIPLRSIDIVEHCERLLEGGESYTKIPQEDAWRRLARG
jgi:hypothetical protein